MGRGRWLSRHDPGYLRKAVAHRGEDYPVIPPETFSATHGLEQQQWQDEALGEGTAARTKSGFTATVSATIRLNKERVCGVVHYYTSEE
jgi:hypothetical protein